MEVLGNDLMLFIGGVSVACATSHSLSMSSETSEISTKDHSGKWGNKKVIKKNWNVSTDGLYSTAGKGKQFADLFDLWLLSDPIDVIFATKADLSAEDAPEGGWTPDTQTQWKGKVLLTSLDLSAPSGDKVTYTATFEGVGPLTKVSGGVIDHTEL